MRFSICLSITLLCVSYVNSQNTDYINTLQKWDSSDVYTDIEYPYILWDSPTVLPTMRQLNEDYLSTYRYASRRLYEGAGSRKGSLIQIFAAAILYPVTHEEGHRTILNSKGIGSISKPYWDLTQGAAYVTGVRDSELQNLRDTDLPSYIRLHTAGIESDYMLALRIKSLSVFEQEDRQLLSTDYFIRKFGVTAYYFSSLFKFMEPDITESPDELKRDIVGHDVYSAIRHLHRPSMNFYRYTRYDSLTSVEKKFVKRVGLKSLLNVIDPLTFRSKPNIKISDNLKGMFGLGYSMCPFGDFIDENFWLRYRNKLNMFVYFRQYQNKTYWFPATGISIVDYPIKNQLISTLSLHLWEQPENMSFTATKGSFGAAGEALVKYKFFTKNRTSLSALSINVGIIYKSYGYLPEEIIMDNHLGIRFGTSFYMKQ